MCSGRRSPPTKTSLLWPRRRDNCAAVSNSGILVAALAVLRATERSRRGWCERSLASAWNVFEAFAPDGAWREGLSYWSLAVRYTGLMVAALESTLGDSFGLADRPGFAQTGDFALHAVGTFGQAFNFGDSERASMCRRSPGSRIALAGRSTAGCSAI